MPSTCSARRSRSRNGSVRISMMTHSQQMIDVFSGPSLEDLNWLVHI
ncbi:hypothetical protein ACFFX0_18760 [Citricoccus parietis]|uniref:Uncharacterized protein n=1 Tax=Citricoccus parietis TaxID=592307 RepID=A0ABV5G2H3_9MICC